MKTSTKFSWDALMIDGAPSTFQREDGSPASTELFIVRADESLDVDQIFGTEIPLS